MLQRNELPIEVSKTRPERGFNSRISWHSARRDIPFICRRITSFRASYFQLQCLRRGVPTVRLHAPFRDALR